MDRAIQYSVDKAGVGRMVFDLPGEKVNKLSTAVLEELEAILNGFIEKKETHPSCLVLSSNKPAIFIAGADIKELYEVDKLSDACSLADWGKEIFSKMEALPFPTIACIDGACLGGGLELALSCQYRIATDHEHTRLGLPEVSLGLIPAWGGTQRLPRTIGITRALTMMLTGKPVNARKALKLGLVHGIVAAEFVDAYLNQFIRSLLSDRPEKGRKKSRKKSFVRCIAEKTFFGRKMVFNQAKKSVLKRTKGRYPAPLTIIKLLEETATIPLHKGLKKESEALAAFGEPGFTVFKNLVRIFLAQEALKKDAGVKAEAVVKIPSRAALLGSGVMGGGIAWLFSYRGIPVHMKDLSWEFLSKGFRSANDIYRQLVKIKKIDGRQAALKMHAITASTEYSGFHDRDIVVEAVIEEINIKKNVLQEIEAKVAHDTLICSNTSSLSITEMARALERPERFLGMHFFNPVNRMPLVEVVPGEKTSDDAVASLVALLKKLGKVPVVVKDCPGFLVNRILIPGLLEALRMLEEGVAPEKIEDAFEKFGMPMGPFTLADEVGVDVCLKAATNLNQAYGERMALPVVLKGMVSKQLFGKKTQIGFYLYRNRNVASKFNTAVYTLLEKRQKKGANSLDDQEILNRMLYVMVNEAGRCLEEGVVVSEEYLDLALVMGMGFPAFRGGLMQYTRAVGMDKLVTMMQDYERRWGKRFAPTHYLVGG
ncbi:enoyl-CoA hydratase/isomerase family protein [Simkania negevensis]|uniref:enoyl-CoA hydratase n=1 Tax=Simkania negevensis TaxID=83561 RepID=A0ABS3ASQ3_9BACT|nr:enoyl-CoA hydratase/isomerase family protein [Simkania negevensis]